MFRLPVQRLAVLTLMLGCAAPSAHAGMLSMRFANGTNEVTLEASESTRIDVLFTFGVLDRLPIRMTGVDARFDVGSLAQGVGGHYVVAGPSPFTVTGIFPYNTPSWNTAASTPLPAEFNGNFFLSAGDPNGVHGPHEYQPIGPLPPVASITIRRDGLEAGDYYVVFRAWPPLPAIYNGAGDWQNQFGYPTITGSGQFEIGQGNPGDADPRWAYHGYETLQPLIIHAVPEPGALALLTLAACIGLGRITAGYGPDAHRIVNPRPQDVGHPG